MVKYDAKVAVCLMLYASQIGFSSTSISGAKFDLAVSNGFTPKKARSVSLYLSSDAHSALNGFSTDDVTDTDGLGILFGGASGV
jgi:hypothetical protein